MAHLEGEQRVQQSILVINGPGAFQGISAQLIESACTDLCKELDVKLDFRQAANEEDLHNWIAQTADEVDGLILNPAGCSRLGAVDFGSDEDAFVALIKGYEEMMTRVDRLEDKADDLELDVEWLKNLAKKWERYCIDLEYKSKKK